MKRFYLCAVIAMFGFLFSTTSCNSIKDDFTPEEYKAEVRSAVTESMELIDAADNADLLRVINEAIILSEKAYYAPGITTFATANKNYVSDAALKLQELYRNANEVDRPLRMAALAQAFAPFDEILGTYVYNPQTEKWEYTENDEAFVLIYPFEGKQVVWTLNVIGEQRCTITAGMPEEAVSDMEIILPAKLSGSIVWGDETLFTLEANLELSENADTIHFSMKTNAGGYIEELDLDAAPSRFTLMSKTEIKKQDVLTIAMEANGTSMTDYQKLIAAINSYDPYAIFDFFKDAYVAVTYMDEIVLKGEIRDINAVVDVLRRLEIGTASYEELNKAIEENVSLAFCYANTDNVIATITITVTEDDIIVMINFLEDGTSIPLEDYFDNDFIEELEDNLNDLLEDLQEYLPALFE